MGSLRAIFVWQGTARAGEAALRNHIERFFNRLRDGRRLATRYEKTAKHLLGSVQLASSRLWPKFVNRP